MNRYTLTIHAQGFKWTLHAIARNSCDALLSVIDHIGPGARVTVRAG